MSKECTNQSCTKESCEGCSHKQTDFSVDANANSHVKKVIGVVSGKGGVGKSLVTSLMACAMQKKGYSTAILDADITGPSIPKMFGVHDKATQAFDNSIQPLYSNNGTAMMSVNLLLEDETDPVIWRGPVIANVVKQFWSDVCWGDVDYMFVDMPPGTGDVPLTVFQSLPVDGIIIVTTPQDLVSMIVSKAVHMADAMNIPILGIVENMSYFVCPNCNEKHYIFGNNDIHTVAATFAIPLAATLPMDPALAKLCDEGQIEQWDTSSIDDLTKLLEA
ncbi:MAG: Mrp/NBP35 family ATP-binding protein [Clostridiales bacterium]|nr:Mrp/NBP35 family ATP-binding protein [Clostridiales bacterium]